MALDEDLALSVGTGNMSALGDLFERHQKRVYNHALRILSNEEDASDVLMEVFEYLMTHLNTYEPRAKFTTYLFKITHGISLRKLKSRHSCSLEDLEIEADNLPDKITKTDSDISEARKTQLEEAINDLPLLQSEILFLRFKLELSYEELGHILEIPLGTVKSRLNAAISSLRRNYKDTKG
jgi:RNA polymerase sigma-70 factor (ECF subfamily)